MSTTAREIQQYVLKVLGIWLSGTTDTFEDGRKHTIQIISPIEDGSLQIRLDARQSNPRVFELSLGVREIVTGESTSDPEVTESLDEIKLLREQVANLQQAIGEERARHASDLRAEQVKLETELNSRNAKLELEFATNKRKEAQATAARSRTALVAKIAEHFAPLMSGFPYNFKDVRHVGEVFDFLVYDGIEEGEIRKVVFLEVKTKKSGARVTNPREKMLRKAIEEGRVSYEVYTPDVGDAKVDSAAT